jgi:hypothetical protein
MAARELLRALLRYWPVVVVGALLTGLGLLGSRQVAGVYETRTTMILLPPGSSVPNPLLASDGSLVATAAALQRSVERGTVVNRMASNSVSISGLGAHHGYSVRLPPTGNQWVFWFERAVLDVQVVGATPAEVERGLATATARIEDTLTRMQDDADVPAAARIRIATPPDASIVYGRGRPARAQVGIVILGIGLTLALVSVVRRRAERWQLGGSRRASGSGRPRDPSAPALAFR